MSDLIENRGQQVTSLNHAKEPQRIYGEPPAAASSNADAQARADAEVEATIKGSLAALQRAAQAARKLAQQTGTDLIVMRNGVITRVSPDEEKEA